VIMQPAGSGGEHRRSKGVQVFVYGPRLASNSESLSDFNHARALIMLSRRF
jgi:hypothetical protein